MANLKGNPYFLDDEEIQWVHDTIQSMTTEEKIGQLFFNMGSSREEDYLKMTVQKYHIGGVRYNPGPSVEIREQNRILQENSKIPCLSPATRKPAATVPAPMVPILEVR